MSTPVLYSIDFSPPCRAVRLTAQAIGLELDVKYVENVFFFFYLLITETVFNTIDMAA